MASRPQFQHQSRAPFESPAKIFAKLKSKLRRPTAGECSDDEGRAAEEFRGAPITESRGPDRPGDLSPLRTLETGEVTAVTLSPIASPQKGQYRTDCDPGRGFNPACRARRTPLLESTAVQDFHARGLDDDGLPHLISPSAVFSPVRKRLRKRPSDDQLLRRDVDCAPCPEKVMKVFPVFREEEHVTSTRIVEPFARDFAVEPQHNGRAGEMLPHSRMNPAKIFAFLKKRENQKDQCDVPLDTSPGPDADRALQSETGVGADSGLQGDASADEDFPHDAVADAPLQPVLLEDPLVLNSPRVSIPKTQTVCRRTKWSQRTTFPTENVIHLRRWFIRENRQGLFVDGIHRDNDIEWNSNIISERVSRSVLRTISGRVYILVGKMLHVPSHFPKWFLKKFANGFPSNWKELHQKYLLESKGNPKKRCEEQDKKPRQSLKTSVNQSSLACPSSSSAPSAKVSRSGRLLKPPLDYWKGGRVILDAHMNVTVHDSYDTTVIGAEITTPVSTKSKRDKQAALVMVPLNNACEKPESVSKHQLQRKARVPQRKPRQDHDTVPKMSPNTNTTGRVTRSSQNCSMMKNDEEAEEAKKCVDHRHRSAPARRSPPADLISSQPSAMKEKTTDHRLRSAPARRWPPADLTSSQPSAVKEKTTDHRHRSAPARRSPPADLTSSQPSAVKEKTTDHRHRSARRSPPADLTSSQPSAVKEKPTDHSGASQRKLRRRPGRTDASSGSSRERGKPGARPRRGAGTPSPTTTAARPSRARVKPLPAQDPDDWSEEELRRLQGALSCDSRHLPNYWTHVAKAVGTRSAAECHQRHTSSRTGKTSPKGRQKAKKEPSKKREEPVISARVGTLRRKQQVRDFLEAMPKDEMEDVFSSAYVQSKRTEVCTDEDHDFSVSDQGPLTPRPAAFHEAKTPQCLHITPGMMGSSSKNFDDKFVFQLQKKMKNQYQFNVEKNAKKSKANFTPSASMKKTMRRCANTEDDTFVVWEMFPDKEAAQADSGEEEDFYFSEND